MPPIHTLMILPTQQGVGLTSVSLGLVRALDSRGLTVGFIKPIAQPHPGDPGPERSTSMLRVSSALNPPEPLSIQYADRLLSENRLGELMEQIVGQYNQAAQGHSIMVVEGLVPNRAQPYATRLNQAIAKALDAELILVSSPESDQVAELDEKIEIMAQAYGGLSHRKLLGVILNRLQAPTQVQAHPLSPLVEQDPHTGPAIEQILSQSRLFKSHQTRLLGAIPWLNSLIAPRVQDIAGFVGAQQISPGDLNRRVQKILICARSMNNVIPSLSPGVLVVTPGDRSDILVASCMAVLNGVPIAGVLLTGGYQPDARLLAFCAQAIERGLPILSIDSDSYGTALQLTRMNLEIPIDDLERIDSMMSFVAGHIDVDRVQELCAIDYERRLSPPAFRHQLVQRAARANKRIVLPEGNEPRTIEAAIICTQRQIARCLLLAKPAEVERIAQSLGLPLPAGLQILDPEQLRAEYVGPMVELRKSKGLTEIVARTQLEDNVMLGTMMLQQGQVDGLVSGAVHTTANTIRPALQLIKTAPQARIVSSIFFMCLPDQVLVYGDCAVNPDPNAEELADIALQSADSAAAFGITPRVAMISYSTGQSGTGSDVDKVRTATRIAQEKRPDLLIDGPLQYDAALIEEVARSKAPDSPVAGRATVVIFPDLNTGNTTYKAVQRSAEVISIGPMLQGLRRPVNDLSRGALVDDIVFTIALTAIQAEQAGLDA